MQEQEAWEQNALANIKRLNDAISEQKAEIDSLAAEKQQLAAQMRVPFTPCCTLCVSSNPSCIPHQAEGATF